MLRAVLLGAVGVLALAGSAAAEPPADLVQGLRLETAQTRKLLREAMSFCAGTIYPSTPTRDVAACQDRWEMAKTLPTQPVVVRALADLKEKRDVAGLRAMINLQQGRELAAKAAPLFDDFLTAIDRAEQQPAKAKPKPAKG